MARQNRPYNEPRASSGPVGPTGYSSISGPGGATGSTNVQVVRRPSADEIRKRAYELFCARKGQGGSPEEDWLRAERELMARNSGL